MTAPSARNGAFLPVTSSFLSAYLNAAAGLLTTTVNFSASQAGLLCYGTVDNYCDNIQIRAIRGVADLVYKFVKLKDFWTMISSKASL
ncbi:hypothetical protein PEBR_06655 [Penicillium brasilianum]|uniref:Uncharacterized protein n=1 Tax=Penicillium brasilianum TaxID=104259 RepID=A0A1S9RWD0_PENBI|nr:hypothetical protein PEBR_06655 [Penicillium brasilianum]